MILSAILSDVRSIHNVGSIFRTADGAGFTNIYLCGITPEPVDRFKKIRPDFAKVSLGAEKSVTWEYVAQSVALIENLKREGWRIFALEQSNHSIPLASLNSRVLQGMRVQRAALVVGSETAGLSPDILELADMIVEIPMFGAKESLNVAVAFGLAAYALRSAAEPFPASA